MGPIQPQYLWLGVVAYMYVTFVGGWMHALVEHRFSAEKAWLLDAAVFAVMGLVFVAAKQLPMWSMSLALIFAVIGWNAWRYANSVWLSNALPKHTTTALIVGMFVLLPLVYVA